MPTAKSATKPSAKSNRLPGQTGTVPQPRRVKLPAPKLLRLKRIHHPVRLPNVWQLSKKTCSLLWRHRWLFLGIALVYALLSIVFVNGLSGGTDVNGLKQELSQFLGGTTGQVAIGISIFATLLSSGGNPQTSGGVYQIFLGLIVSLATIWVLRKVVAGEPARLKLAFYEGMAPLIPFILVLVVVLLQTIPVIIGGGLYSAVVTYGIAITSLEKLLWGMLFFVLALISAYMLCSSLFALYIVTLPEMTPLKALRSARKLVQYRRASVFRKLLFLPIALLLIAALITIPVIWFAAPLAQWVFFALAILGLVVAHTYMYTLYRELLE